MNHHRKPARRPFMARDFGVVDEAADASCDRTTRLKWKPGNTRWLVRHSAASEHVGTLIEGIIFDGDSRAAAVPEGLRTVQLAADLPGGCARLMMVTCRSVPGGSCA